MIGELDRSGIGAPVEVDKVPSLGELWASCRASNEKLLTELREDEHSLMLLQLARQDAALGRLSQPMPVEQFPLGSFLLHPRFAGVKEQSGGPCKVRALDHFSWSATTRRKEDSVNGHIVPAEKMSHDTLDMLGEAMKRSVACFACNCMLRLCVSSC